MIKMRVVQKRREKVFLNSEDAYDSRQVSLLRHCLISELLHVCTCPGRQAKHFEVIVVVS